MTVCVPSDLLDDKFKEIIYSKAFKHANNVKLFLNNIKLIQVLEKKLMVEFL